MTAHSGQPHEFRTICRLCGEAGFLNVALVTDNEVVRIEKRAAHHHHEWTDAPEDETLRYCPTCGRVETREGERPWSIQALARIVE
jgi:hypothetical protein